MEYDKINDHVGFNEASHVYQNINTQERYISVTTLIHEYTPPFDTEFQSKKKALERLAPERYSEIKGAIFKANKLTDKMIEYCQVTKDELDEMQRVILAEWKAKADEACEKGTAYHLEQEMALYNKSSKLIDDHLHKDYHCVQGDCSIMNQEVGVFPEYLIYYEDKDLRIAGQVDILVKDGCMLDILDHKTNREIKKKGYFNPKTKKSYKMLSPVSDLDDCNLNHYTLQLSMYAWMVNQKHPELNVRHLKLLHVDHDGKETVIPVPYLKDHVEKIIKSYKKKLKTKAYEEFLNNIENNEA